MKHIVLMLMLSVMVPIALAQEILSGEICTSRWEEVAEKVMVGRSMGRHIRLADVKGGDVKIYSSPQWWGLWETLEKQQRKHLVIAIMVYNNCQWHASNGWKKRNYARIRLVDFCSKELIAKIDEDGIYVYEME